uniref:Dol-P-Glc:Glc(2)Man(9)GlcNAc(2)-PP-Dol alpha-1,2-glucosyltransferase n=1 Tax=Caenorhabditis japonica TaxID=281687 RepID=A0A8R1HT00_CAEJA
MSYESRRIRLPFSAITRKTDFLLAAFFACIHVLLTTIVYHYVPENYMDEVFHITQTRLYCAGNYTWNPLITTPPALYVLSMPFCGGYERYANSVVMFFTIPALCRFRRMFLRTDVWLTVSIVAMLPIVLCTQVLFYTDLLSLMAVMWGFTIGNPHLSSLFFLLACLTRQTNIVWAAVYAFSVLASKIDTSKSVHQNFKALVPIVFWLWPFVSLAVGFIGFIYWNNFQIVLGDAKAHQPKLHLAQFLYMLGFSAAHSWAQMMPDFFSHLRQLIDFKARILIPIFACFAYYFTYSHEYLLADNRHLTFYLWRRIFENPFKRASLTALYVFAVRFMATSTPNVHVFHKTLFIVASLLLLVPAHLFEMRYYIVPYVVWRLAVSNHPRKSFLVLELVSQCALFGAAFSLFLFKTFEWPNEPGVKQRIMF